MPAEGHMRAPLGPAASRGRLFFASAVLACRVHARAAVVYSPPVVAAPAPILGVVLDMDGVTTPNTGALWACRGQEFLRGVAPGWAEGDLPRIKWKSLPDVHRWITENRGARLS